MTIDDRSTWDKLKNQEQQWLREAFALWNRIEDKEAVLKEALEQPSNRGSVLHLLLLLDDKELTTCLFPTLIDLVSVGHADIALCRAVIRTMTREWLLAHIEQQVVPLLMRGGEEEYRRIAELYAEIDASLLERHVQRALAHANQDVREVGQDFQTCAANSFYGSKS